MAETRQTERDPQLQYKEYEPDAKEQERRNTRETFVQYLKQCTQKPMYNGQWPTTWDNFVAVYLIIFLVMTINQPMLNCVSHYIWLFGEYLYLDDSYSHLFRVMVISLASSCLYVIVSLYVRQYILRILLSYKGWLYQAPKSRSPVVLVWSLMVRLFSITKPTLYSYQNTLPRMNVPALKDTISKLLESLKPVLGKDEFRKIELDAKEFLGNLGPKLQWVLYLKSWWSRNYHTDWWETYAYLSSRDPIAINSNYYIHDQIKWIPTKCQTARAAGVTSLILSFKSLIDTEELEPLLIQKTIPLCMWQYARMFGTVRIPQTDVDVIGHTPTSKHIVVYAKGHFYKVCVVDSHGKYLSSVDLQAIYDWILKDADTWMPENDAELRIAALTGVDRVTWAKCRDEHFTSGTNRESVNTIEEAILYVVLDENEFSDASERSKYMLHGNGSSLWFDKSVTAVFFKDGKMGVHCEHTWGDATVVGHMVEYFIMSEYSCGLYDEEGNCRPSGTSDNNTISSRHPEAVVSPMRLHWDINADLERVIKESYTISLKNAEDLQCCFRIHDVFGKGSMKKSKNSPDGFIQLAIQLAYYKDSGGSFAHTYEASTARLYAQGRTETVRSLTLESQQFVLAMYDENVTAQEKIRLMRIAANKHQKSFRDAMAGKGIDRHLFALYVVSKGQGYDSPFLKNVLMMPWILSTSQGALQTNHGLDVNKPEVAGCLFPGGGFGPVSNQGYGVGYAMVNETVVCFHVSAKNSCDKTNPFRFMDNIFSALADMKKLYGDI